MPQCCVVPECSNRKSGHRLPKDKDLLKKWMVAIRRDTVLQGGKVREVSPSPHWRVCNDHFAPEDFVMPKDSVLKNPRPILKKDVVPSRFAWTRRASDNFIKKRERVGQLRSQIVTTGTHRIETSDLLAQKTLLNAAPPDRVETSDLDAQKTVIYSAPPPLLYFSQPTEVLEEIEHVNVNEIKAEPVDFLVGLEVEGAEFHVEAEYHEGTEVNVGAEYHNEVEHLDETNCLTKNAEIQCSLCSCGCGPGQEFKQEEIAPQSSRVTNHLSTYFRIEHLLDKVDELKFYTGFGAYDHFMFVFNLLGDQVNNLQYFTTDQICTLADLLSPVNQFFMTLVKLQRNMTYIELGFRFGVSSTYAEVVVVTWINFLYSQLKLWAKSEEMEKYFKLKKEKSSAAISASSEVNIPIVDMSETQQQTYIIYKFCNTFKVIVGILPNGWVNCVSEAFGESIKDGELFEKSCFKDLLQDEDVIVCDQDFKDCLPHKNVTFDTSHILRSKPDQYQRIIHLGKTFEILQSRLSSDLEQLNSKIISVCIMLTNFVS